MPPAPLTPALAAEKLRSARSLAVLTGAGLSTAAGIPDFRGPEGLYATGKYDPETIFDIAAFDRDPAAFYRFSRDFLSLLEKVRPTLTHRFLADWENSGRAVTVITQNIDGLHRRAGSRTVLPLHGDYETAHCRRCGRDFTGAELLKLMEPAESPLCPACGGFVKPDVVFFGENVRHMEPAFAAVRESEALLVLGTSLAVWPAAGLPGEAGGEVLVVNRGPVAATASVSGKRPLRADADLDEFFAEVAAILL